MRVSTDTKPWYKQPWVWFLMGLPAAVVVASVVSYFIALNGIDSVISKDYYKDGLAINTDLTRDKQAQALGLSADVTIEGQSVTVKLNARDVQTVKDMAMQPLQFELENLSFQAQNVQAVLIHTADGVWRGQMNGQLRQSTWHARVMSGDWRITQRIENRIPTHFVLKP